MARNYAEIIAQAATQLISTAGIGVAVHTTNIEAATRELSSRADGYSQSKIENDLKREIEKRHNPGITR